MSVRHRALIELLADGSFHSGEALAQVLGVSRTAVWKQLQSLAEIYQLEVQAVRGRGYRLARPIELLSANAVEAAMDPRRRVLLSDIEVLDSVASTSGHLAAGVNEWGQQGRACLAERQTQGRGRRGRTWVSPFGANLYLSLYWPFELPMARLNGLSLAAGVAVARALDRLGVAGVALKWPNDIYHEERKLGGILVEVFGQTAGPVAAVLGVGLNVDMPPSAGQAIDQSWTDLRRAMPGAGLVRNRLAGLVLDEMVETALLFTREGWPAFQGLWRAFDAYEGREVEVHTAERIEQGIYLGVDADGGLILGQDGSRRVFHAGDVSLRHASGGSAPGREAL
jgi:BirA family biotin operon repressor/biotin-[acetyl-CoA-carboxylase] ligase